MKSYLQMHVTLRETMPRPEGYAYLCLEDFVLRCGEPFVSSPLDDSERRVVEEAVERVHASGQSLEVQQCFANAQMLVLSSGGRLTYHEGYAQGSTGVPMHHAWASIHGKVIDLTWSTLPFDERGLDDPSDRIWGEFPEDWLYLGTSFELAAIRRMWREHGVAGSLILNWQDGYPVLRGER